MLSHFTGRISTSIPCNSVLTGKGGNLRCGHATEPKTKNNSQHLSGLSPYRSPSRLTEHVALLCFAEWETVFPGEGTRADRERKGQG